MNEIQVVVLMGGLGSRLAGQDSRLPKAMVQVHGRPFFHYQLQLMQSRGLKKFLFCIGHKGEAVKSYFKDGRRLGVNIQYSQDGKTLLGTSGALKNAVPFLEDDFMLIYGDSYMDVDFAELIYMYRMFKREEKVKAMLVVYKNRNRFEKSNVVFQGGRLLKYDKSKPSPKMQYVDYGISFLEKKVAEAIPGDKFVDLADIYKELIKRKQMAGYEVRSRFYEIGRPDSLEEFRKFIYHGFASKLKRLKNNG